MDNRMLHFPVGYLMDKVLNLFQWVGSEKEHRHAIDNGLKHSLKFITSDKIVGQSGSLTGENEIEIYDNYCQFLYLICYSLLVMNDCQALLVEVRNADTLSPEQKETIALYQEAEEIFREALRMLKPNENDKEFMASSRGKIWKFPGPHNPNQYTEFANSMAEAGMAYILHHEFGHFVYEHDGDTPKNELEADRGAILKLKEWGQPQGFEKMIFTGIILSLVATAFINPTLVSPSYPDIDDRIEYALSFMDEKDLENPDFLMYRIISFSAVVWANHFAVEIPIREMGESYKDFTCRIKKYLTSYKRQYKII